MSLRPFRSAWPLGVAAVFALCPTGPAAQGPRQAQAGPQPASRRCSASSAMGRPTRQHAAADRCASRFAKPPACETKLGERPARTRVPVLSSRPGENVRTRLVRHHRLQLQRQFGRDRRGRLTVWPHADRARGALDQDAPRRRRMNRGHAQAPQSPNWPSSVGWPLPAACGPGAALGRRPIGQPARKHGRNGSGQAERNGRAT